MSSPPAAMAVAPERPDTSTAVIVSVRPGLPSPPLKLAPQHATVPPAIRAHEWDAPAATSVAPVIGTDAGGEVDVHADRPTPMTATSNIATPPRRDERIFLNMDLSLIP